MAEQHAVIAREVCGCVVAAAVLDIHHLGDVSRTVAGWKRAGLTLEELPLDQVRDAICGGVHPRGSCAVCPQCGVRPKQATRYDSGVVGYTCQCGQIWGTDRRSTAP